MRMIGPRPQARRLPADRRSWDGMVDLLLENGDTRRAPGQSASHSDPEPVPRPVQRAAASRRPLQPFLGLVEASDFRGTVKAARIPGPATADRSRRDHVVLETVRAAELPAGMGAPRCGDRVMIRRALGSAGPPSRGRPQAVDQQPGAEVGGADRRTSRVRRDRPDPDPRRARAADPRGGADHPGGGAVAKRAKMIAALALATCLVGVLVGDFVVYFLGYFYGEKVLSLPADPPAPDPGQRGPDQGLFSSPRVQDPDPGAVRGRLPDGGLPDGGHPQAPSAEALPDRPGGGLAEHLPDVRPGLRLRQPDPERDPGGPAVVHRGARREPRGSGWFTATTRAACGRGSRSGPRSSTARSRPCLPTT